MRLFGLLGGGWSINFSQQTLWGIRAFDPGSRRRWISAGEGAEPRSGGVYRAIETAWIQSTRVKHEIKRCRPSSENLMIGSASKMTGADVERTLPIATSHWAVIGIPAFCDERER